MEMLEVHMASDVIDLLYHFPYAFSLFFQNGLDALALVGTEGDAGFSWADALFHLFLLVFLLHFNLSDCIAQVLQLVMDCLQFFLHISFTV